MTETHSCISQEIRTTGHSSANAVARLGAFVSPYLVKPSTSFQVVGTIMLLISFVMAFYVLKLPESKGKELGAIETERLEEEASAKQAAAVTPSQMADSSTRQIV
jgi:sugar phosphate permease